MELSKSDWSLFREKLPQWQENYMEQLTKKYINLLNSDCSAADRFWALEKQIEADKRKPCVIVTLRKSDVVFQLAALLRDKAITTEDLNDFSDELKEKVNQFSHD